MPLSFLFLSWALFFLWALTFDGVKDSEPVFRKAFVRSVLFFSLQCLLFTEGLSLFRLLEPVSLGVCYAASIGITGAILVRRRRRLAVCRARIRALSQSVDRPTAVLAVAASALVLLPLLVLAFLWPPHSTDAMAYHLPRIEHWIQNRNVSFYPTPDSRQLCFQPLANYLTAHFFLFTNFDSWANFVSWSFYAGSLLAVSLIAAQLGLSARGQFLAAAFAMSTPMAIAQATGNLIDLAAAFFFLSFCQGGLELMSGKRKERCRDTVLFSVALGLGVLVKATVAFFAIPFCLGFAVVYITNHWDREFFSRNNISRIGSLRPFCGLTRRAEARLRYQPRWARRFPIRDFCRYAVLCVAICLAIPSAYLYRNMSAYGHPLGPTEHRVGLKSGSSRASHTASNFVLHVALQSSVASRHYQQVVSRIVRACHAPLLGDDGRLENDGLEFDWSFMGHEVQISNMLPTWLFFGLFFLLCLQRGLGSMTGRRRRPGAGSGRRRDLVLLYGLCLFGGLIVFCAVMKWNTVIGRLLLPWLLGVAPFIAAVLSPMLGRGGTLRCSALLIPLALAGIFCCQFTALSLGHPGFHWKRAMTRLRRPESESPRYPGKLAPELAARSAPPASVDNSAGSDDQALLDDLRTGRLWSDFLHDRDWYLFADQPWMKIDFDAAEAVLEALDAKNVGLAFERGPVSAESLPFFLNQWEYPLFRSLKRRGKPFRIEHVLFPEELKRSRNYDAAFVPDVIVSRLFDPSPLGERYELGEPVDCGLFRVYPVRGVKRSPDRTSP